MQLGVDELTGHDEHQLRGPGGVGLGELGQGAPLPRAAAPAAR